MSSSGSELARPADLREAHETIAAAAKDGRRVLLRGAGTAQSWGAPTDEVDLTIETTGMDQLIAYNPADMTIAVGAGMPLTRLQTITSSTGLTGQRVALDPARAAHGATIGGLLATNDGGPLRSTYGTLRDLVIGATVVLPDGSVARSGGHVIKNVAGYDLTKVFCGSLGVFGLIAEVVLRLHPLPERTATLAVPGDLDASWELAVRLASSPLEPVALDWHSGSLYCRFEGTHDGVERRLVAAVELAGSAATVLGDDADARARAAADDVVLGAEGDTVARAGSWPDRVPPMVDRLAAVAGEHGVTVEVYAQLGVGVHTVRMRGGDAAAHAAVLGRWRDDVLAGGGNVTVLRHTPGLTDHTACWTGEPGGLSVLRGLKRELDPGNRFAPGRFAPWL